LSNVCESDTENDDTLTSTRSQRSAAVAATTLLDDIVDDDSDFEVSSKPRASTRATGSRGTAKYCAVTITISH